MRSLNPELDLARFFSRVRAARERVLLLDYDGTLAPFHRRPDRAWPYPRVARILGRAMGSCATRVVIVSGRSAADMRAPLARLPCHEAWACHGWEQLTPLRTSPGRGPADSARRRLQLAERPARRLALHGARIERKEASIAVHWRGLPEALAQGLRERLADAWRPFEDELDVMDFDGGLELRARGRDKGHVVRDVLGGFSADVACAYLGDDRTDEDAFAAIRGRGLGVLVRPKPRESAAELWISPPEELVSFLERWCASAAP